ncbi:MAG: hypothetical protein A2Z37_10580 [Chloroflexi bacterium RBG_19FT_COMBO_62_14]|nr:MAG: hypothetical protein A2Z37_10580 [Chloroflexi bacterium RBG_19FT_COMBO_62_14]
MVHALAKIHSLLQPTGVLVDIHPTPEPPAIQVRVGSEIHAAGWLREADDYVEYEEADRAIDDAIELGMFVLERQGQFDFTTHAGTLRELKDHLEAEWQEAFIEDTTILAIEDLLRTPQQDKEILLRESVRISRLRPLPR